MKELHTTFLNKMEFFCKKLAQTDLIDKMKFWKNKEENRFQPIFLCG